MPFLCQKWRLVKIILLTPLCLKTNVRENVGEKSLPNTKIAKFVQKRRSNVGENAGERVFLYKMDFAVSC